MSGSSSTRSPASLLTGLAMYVQPIVQLTSGKVIGFEALARIHVGDQVRTPDRFLPEFSDQERRLLFHGMLRRAVQFLDESTDLEPGTYISVNVESSLMSSEDFCAEAEAIVGRRSAGQPKVVLELLESEKIQDLEQLRTNLERLRETGIGISLDDVGSAYSSLMLLKRLPIDVIKLDQAFARELLSKPDDLQFVHSLVSLAQGLGKKLVVEGIEMTEIQDALSILGVEFGQGYAVARPMPVERLGGWLRDYRPRARQRVPQSLLGSYAAHLNVVETFRLLAKQPLPIKFESEVKDPHLCDIGRFFDAAGLHDTPFGQAHKDFHAVIDLFASEPSRWERASEEFKSKLETALMWTRANATSSTAKLAQQASKCSCSPAGIVSRR